PAGIDRGADAVAGAGSRERGRMRRRLRELRRLREAQLLELGALVLEAHKHGRADSPVIKTKASEAAATDAEARTLAEALDADANEHAAVTEVRDGRAAQEALACPNCGAPADAGQLMCLECGQRLALGYKRPPSWRLPAAVVAVVLLLAGIGVAIALAAVSN